MNQTFYIDIEEEISSVIDRLNKSMSNDNYFVIPKRALFLQSIVNLKLLKREADKVGKRVIIVTQDEIGASMAERSGIEARATLEGVEEIQSLQIQNDDEEEYVEAEAEDDAVDHLQQDEQLLKQQLQIRHMQDDRKIRLSGVGSDSFYDANFQEKKKVEISAQNNGLSAAGPQHSMNNAKKAPVLQKANFQYANQMQKFPPKINSSEPKSKVAPIASYGPQYSQQKTYMNSLDPIKERNVEKMFSNRQQEKYVPPKTQPAPKVEGKMKKIFLSFAILCSLAFLGIVAFLLVPSAKITLVPNILKNKADVVIAASVDAEKTDTKNIALRVFNKEEKISLSYNVSGSSTVSGKKAHGRVTIYNEFSNASQTLIATTRLESTDGKIFRLTKNVVVPGSTTVSGQIKPGVITADVVADQAGEDFNLESSEFKIPGFKDSPKYDKFYGKSTEKFLGGSSDGEAKTGGAVSQKDLDNAKEKTQQALKEKIEQMIAGELADGEKNLSQAEKIDFTKAVPSVKVGDVVESFDYSVVASVHALIFSEKDVTNILLSAAKENAEIKDYKLEIAKVEYGTVEADFDNNKLSLKVHGEVTAIPNIDTTEIKAQLLGKTDEQLSEVLKKHLTIKNINIEFSPSFLNRVPQYSQRVNVEIANE